MKLVASPFDLHKDVSRGIAVLSSTHVMERARRSFRRGESVPLNASSFSDSHFVLLLLFSLLCIKFR